jgi:hypothetical protein
MVDSTSARLVFDQIASGVIAKTVVDALQRPEVASPDKLVTDALQSRGKGRRAAHSHGQDEDVVPERVEIVRDIV